MKTLVSYYFEEEEEEEIVKDTQGPEHGQIQVSATPLRTAPKAWDSDMPPFNSEPTAQSLLGSRFPWLLGVWFYVTCCGGSGDITCSPPTASGLGGPNSL